MTSWILDVELWGDVEEFAVNPPTIVLEFFDMDDGGEEEFIGRALAKPIIKLAEEQYDKPFFPPALQWFPIFRGESKGGELLAAFELLQGTFHSIVFPLGGRVKNFWGTWAEIPRGTIRTQLPVSVARRA